MPVKVVSKMREYYGVGPHSIPRDGYHYFIDTLK